jgi:hypothetical protein
MFYLSPTTKIKSPITVDLPFQKETYDANQERPLLIVWNRGKSVQRMFVYTIMSMTATFILTSLRYVLFKMALNAKVLNVKKKKKRIGIPLKKEFALRIIK